MEDTTKLIPPSKLPKVEDLMQRTHAVIPTLHGDMTISWKWNDYAAKHRLIHIEINGEESYIPANVIEHFLRMA